MISLNESSCAGLHKNSLLHRRRDRKQQLLLVRDTGPQEVTCLEHREHLQMQVPSSPRRLTQPGKRLLFDAAVQRPSTNPDSCCDSGGKGLYAFTPDTAPHGHPRLCGLMC